MILTLTTTLTLSAQLSDNYTTNGPHCTREVSWVSTNQDLSVAVVYSRRSPRGLQVCRDTGAWASKHASLDLFPVSLVSLLVAVRDISCREARMNLIYDLNPFSATPRL
jgi:hypothetical protein